ncbi:hypothetical protein FACS18949_06220 [Clostridia bacterium]|nr:hypothetical protein FACS18949_06220 [Clostridia bacterium]
MKRFFSNRNIAIAVICVLAVVAVGGGISYATGNEQPYNMLTAYTNIEKTNEGIQSYVVATRALGEIIAATELNGIMTTITFSARLSAEEIFEFAEKYNLEIVQAQGRGYEADGTWIGVAARGDIGLERMKESVGFQAENNNFTFAGYTGINAKVNASELTEIQNDTAVFLADASGDRYFQGFTQINGSDRNYEDGRRMAAYQQSLAWPIEELGLLNETTD